MPTSNFAYHPARTDLDRKFLQTTNPEQAANLLAAGASIRALDENGRTKLSLVIESKQYGILAVLLAYSAELTSKSCHRALAKSLQNRDEKAAWMIALSNAPHVQDYIQQYGADFLITQLTKLDFKSDPKLVLRAFSTFLTKSGVSLAEKVPTFSTKNCQQKFTNDHLDALHLLIKASVLIFKLDPKHLAITTCKGWRSDKTNYIDIANKSESKIYVSDLLATVAKTSDTELTTISRNLIPFERTDLLNFSDLFDFTLRYLVGPEILNQLTPGELNYFNAEQLDKALKEIKPHLAEYLLSTRRIDFLLNLSAIWHENITEFNTLVRDFDVQVRPWPAIIPNGKIELTGEEFSPQVKDWEIINLTNNNELNEEGKKLRHCVSGYDQKCLSGHSHIFSIRNSNGILQSTFELAIPNKRLLTIAPPQNPKYPLLTFTSASGKPTHLILSQHCAYRNTEPTTECKAILQWFLNSVGGGEIILNKENFSLNAEEETTTAATLVENFVGIYKRNLTADRKQNIMEIFGGRNNDFLKLRFGRKKALLPRAEAAAGYDKFFESSGLRAEIHKALRQ